MHGNFGSNFTWKGPGGETRTLIKNGKIIKKENQLIKTALWLENGVVHAIGESFDEADFGQVFDANGQLITPGLVDVHAHLRELGFTCKETTKTGSKATARGGLTTVCAMLNLSPVPDTTEESSEVYDLIQKDAVMKVLQYAPTTEELRSEVLTNQKALREAGAFAFTNDGAGVQTAGTMYSAMKEAAVLNMALVAHAEDESLLFDGMMHEREVSKKLGLPEILSATEVLQIAQDITLAKRTGVHCHVCHVSTEESVRVIRDVRKAGIHATAEVSPHHLILVDEDIPGDEGFWKMDPPLRGSTDRQALIGGLLDGTIDYITTDHAPYGLEEKQQLSLNVPLGIVGSETAFQLIYMNFVETGISALEQVIDWMAVKSAEIFGLDAGTLTIDAPADIAAFDLATIALIDTEAFESMAVNILFTGWTVKGKTLITFVDGVLAWSEEAQ